MRAILPLFLMLGACSDSSDVLEQLPNSSIAGAPRDDMPETRLEAKITRPVTIGEDGPRGSMLVARWGRPCAWARVGSPSARHPLPMRRKSGGLRKARALMCVHAVSIRDGWGLSFKLRHLSGVGRELTVLLRSSRSTAAFPNRSSGSSPMMDHA